MKDIINRLGEQWQERHLLELGLEHADKVCDFYNNGGLPLCCDGVEFAIQYAAVVDGKVEIGAWAWGYGEDFDTNATFEVYEEDDFSAAEQSYIIGRIKSIYEKEN